MLETSFEIINAKNLRVSRQGNGEAILLLHGYPDNLQVFSNLVPYLSKHYKVIAFDWPGTGESEEWKGGATPIILAKRLAGIMDHMGIDKAHIIGQDMGGQPALVFAAQFPGRTISVTVMNALTGKDEKTSWEISLLRKFGFNQLSLKYFPRIVFHHAVNTFLRSVSSLSHELKDDLRKNFLRKNVRSFISRMCAGYEAQMNRLPQLYASIQSPVFILWAEKEKHFPIAHANTLKNIIPNAKLQIIKDGYHWMVVEDADRVATAIMQFYVNLNN